MGGFADRFSAQWNAEEIDVFEGWLDIPDQIFYAWLTGREPQPPSIAGLFFDRLADFARHYSDVSGSDS